MAVGLMLIVISAAADPQNWQWLAHRAPDAPPDAHEPLDLRVVPHPARAEPMIEMPAPPPDEQPEEQPDEQPAAEETGRKLLPGFDRAWLQPIRDDGKFRAAEDQTLVRILKLLADTDSAEIAQASVGPISYVQLYRQPDVYRGQVISLSGTLHGAFPRSPPANDLGIDSYYQLWLEPSYRDDPMVIYCLELPPGFPQGEKLKEQVELNAVFLKQWIYPRSDGVLYRAPVLLAKELRWIPSPPAPAAPPSFFANPNLYLAIGAALVFTALFMLYALRRPAPTDDPWLHAHRAPRQPLERLKDVEVAPDVEEWLKSLPDSQPTESQPTDPSR